MQETNSRGGPGAITAARPEYHHSMIMTRTGPGSTRSRRRMITAAPAPSGRLTSLPCAPRTNVAVGMPRERVTTAVPHEITPRCKALFDQVEMAIPQLERVFPKFWMHRSRMFGAGHMVNDSRSPIALRLPTANGPRACLSKQGAVTAGNGKVVGNTPPGAVSRAATAGLLDPSKSLPKLRGVRPAMLAVPPVLVHAGMRSVGVCAYIEPSLSPPS